MLLAVLALHLLIVAVLLGSRKFAEPAAQQPPPRSTVRFMPLPPTPRSATTTTPSRTPPSRSADAAAAASTRPDPAPAERAPVTPEAITAPPTTAAITSPTPPASAPPAPSLLDSDATKRAIRDSARARQDEWQPNAPGTPEAKMAKTFGDPRLVEEDLGGGRRRYWQNGRCSESTESRASKLFPEDTLPKPRLVGACP